MHKKTKSKLLKRLSANIPNSPFPTTGKNSQMLVEELFQKSPRTPSTVVPGVELVKQLDIPLNPNQKTINK